MMFERNEYGERDRGEGVFGGVVTLIIASLAAIGVVTLILTIIGEARAQNESGVQCEVTLSAFAPGNLAAVHLAVTPAGGEWSADYVEGEGYYAHCTFPDWDLAQASVRSGILNAGAIEVGGFDEGGILGTCQWRGPLMPQPQDFEVEVVTAADTDLNDYESFEIQTYLAVMCITETRPVCGDANGDGIVSANDPISSIRYLIGLDVENHSDQNCRLP
jgi:hypothetical protein